MTKASLNGQVGLVPLSYVEIVDTFDDLDTATPQTLDSSTPIMARAMYPFAAEGDDELDLNVGDIITVSRCINVVHIVSHLLQQVRNQEDANGWWEGTILRPTIPLINAFHRRIKRESRPVPEQLR
jgi:hypothetical protein